MTPTILEKNNCLFMVVGTPGGSTIITGVFQTILNVIEFGMTMQQAVSEGRFHHQWLPDLIQLEGFGFQTETLRELKNRGHGIKHRTSMGEANCIQIMDDYLFGAADSRRNSHAMGY